MNISLLVPMQRAKEVITLSLSTSAQSILGTDDSVLVSEAYPSLKLVEQKGKTGIFTATREDARTILFDLNERSLVDAGGFCHTATERATARRHAVRLNEQLFGGAQ